MNDQKADCGYSADKIHDSSCQNIEQGTGWRISSENGQENQPKTKTNTSNENLKKFTSTFSDSVSIINEDKMGEVSVFIVCSSIVCAVLFLFLYAIVSNRIQKNKLKKNG